jgi:hypothetical protein
MRNPMSLTWRSLLRSSPSFLSCSWLSPSRCSTILTWPRRIGMAICTRGTGPRQVWHLSGAGAGLDLHPWVHPHSTRGGSGHGCGFQSAPIDLHWAPVYNPCTIILGPKTHGHPKPALKPMDTRWLFHPRVRVFTRQHFRARRVFGQPTPNPPCCHP